MINDSDQARQQMLTAAFNHLQSAIDLLDSADAPGNIAAHADLAARQLEELLPVGKLAGITRTDPFDGAWPAAVPS